MAEVRLGTEPRRAPRAARRASTAPVVLAFNAPASGFVVPNDYVAEYVARDPERLIGSAPSIHPPRRRSTSSSSMRDLGLVRCKLGPIYQDVDLLGPAFRRVCEAPRRLELPMLIHQRTTFARAGSLLRHDRSC